MKGLDAKQHVLNKFNSITELVVLTHLKILVKLENFPKQGWKEKIFETTT